ncbi:MAG: nuclear transport factor 2 family protein, partial [Chitinophagaceae bacterium]
NRKHMNSKIIIPVLLIIVFGCNEQRVDTKLEGEKLMQTTSIEQELIALEHTINDAFHRRDIKTMERILADDIIITYGNGNMANKKQELASFVTGIESSSLDDFKVQLNGDVAVVMLRLTA